MIEFDEMRKVWDEQKGETMYAINEAALHKSVTRRKDAASKRINRVEIGLSIINGTVALILIGFGLHGNSWSFLSAGLFAGTVVYIQYIRWKRKRSENRFDRSMLGELDHAISNANFIIRFNYFMIIGYLIPLTVLNISSMIIRGAPLEKWLIVVGALLVCFIMLRREQKACNLPRKKQLQALREKLTEMY